MADEKILPRDLVENPEPPTQSLTILDDGTNVFATSIEDIGNRIGAVRSVQAGLGISVDNTDPLNPIITATEGGGDMFSAIYDPQGISNDAFARANHTGEQPISATIGLQEALDDTYELASSKETGFSNIVYAEAFSPIDAPDYIRTAGYNTAGDGGGALYKRVDVEPTHSGKFSITLDDGVTVVWYEIAERQLDLRMFGAFGSDDPDALVDETAAIHGALDSAVLGAKLFIPFAHYTFDQYLHTSAFNLCIEGDPANRPVFHVPQEVADASGTAGRFMQFARGNYGDADGDITGLTLAESIVPFQRRIKLTDVTGIEKGMILQITSERLWYYDARGQYYCSEMHLISEVIAETNEVVIDDFTRDTYSTGETLHIRTWEPDRADISNLEIRFPLQAPGSSNRGLLLDRTRDLKISDLKITNANAPGALAVSRAWRPYIFGYEGEGGGSEIPSGSFGYGISANSWYGGTIDRMKTRGLRRSVDFDTASKADIQSVSRDNIVKNSIVTGGNTTVSPGELLNDPSFDDAGAWNMSPQWSITGGQAIRSGGGSGSLNTGIDLTHVPGSTAYITIDVSAITERIRLGFYNGSTNLNVFTDWIATTGVHEFELPIPADATRVYILGETASTTCTLNEVSVKGRTFFYPETDGTDNYGIGGHGAVEGLKIVDCIISDVRYGVNVRSRDTIVEGCSFRGHMLWPVVATFGTGLEVRNNNYRRTDWPNKTSQVAAYGDTNFAIFPYAFVRLGISTGTGDWNYDSPVVIEDNVAHGLQRGFIDFGITSASAVRNLVAKGNTAIVALPPSAPTFTFFNVEGASGVARVNRSFLDAGSNTIYSQTDNGLTRMFPPTANMVLGRKDYDVQSSPSSAVRIGDRKWAATILDDTAMRFRHMATQGDRVLVNLTSDSGAVYGVFLIDQAGTLTALGAVGSAVEGNAAAVLSGTTGTDGKFSVCVNSPGDVCMENRTGASRRIVVEFV